MRLVFLLAVVVIQVYLTYTTTTFSFPGFSVAVAAPAYDYTKYNKVKSKQVIPYTSNNSKFNKALTIMSRTPDHIIDMTPKEYNTYVLENEDRDYLTLLYMTVRDPKYQCTVCPKIDKSISQIASSYLNQRRTKIQKKSNKTDLVSGGDFNLELPQNRLIIGRIDPDMGFRDLLSKLQVTSVPRIYIIPPSNMAMRKAGVEGFSIYELEEDLVNDMAFIQDYEDQETMMKGSGSISLDILKPHGIHLKQVFDPAESIFFILLWSFFATCIAYIFRYHLKWLFFIAKQPLLQWCCCLIFFVSGTSGIVYCILRSPPPYMFLNVKTGQSAYFDPNNPENFIPGLVMGKNPQGQSWGEGFYISFLYILIAICFQSSHNIASTRKYIPQFFLQNFPFNIIIYCLRFLLTLFFFAAGIKFLVTLFTIYSQKVGWYDPLETLDPLVKKFISPTFNGQAFTRRVKSGRVNFLQRLLRLTQILMHEYTTLKSFKKKAYGLIWKYLLRYETVQILDSFIEKNILPFFSSISS